MPAQAEHEAMSNEKLLAGLRCFEVDSDAVAREPELLRAFPVFTDKDAEDGGATEGLALEPAFEACAGAGRTLGERGDRG